MKCKLLFLVISIVMQSCTSIGARHAGISITNRGSAFRYAKVLARVAARGTVRITPKQPEASSALEIEVLYYQDRNIFGRHISRTVLKPHGIQLKLPKLANTSVQSAQAHYRILCRKNGDYIHCDAITVSYLPKS